MIRTDWQNLAGPLTDAGLTILASVIGGPAGGIAQTIGREIAVQLGVPARPEEVQRVFTEEPERAKRALGDFQKAHAEELALLAEEQRHMRDILKREETGPAFKWAWRPATMWLIAFFWLWSLVLVHVLNAFTGATLPVPPVDTLLAFTGIYLALYMGGHTALRALGKDK